LSFILIWIDVSLLGHLWFTYSGINIFLKDIIF